MPSSVGHFLLGSVVGADPLRAHTRVPDATGASFRKIQNRKSKIENPIAPPTESRRWPDMPNSVRQLLWQTPGVAPQCASRELGTGFVRGICITEVSLRTSIPAINRIQNQVPPPRAQSKIQNRKSKIEERIGCKLFDHALRNAEP